MSKNDFKGTVDALFEGVSGVFTSKTVVGDAIPVGDTTLIPLVDISFGIGAGATSDNSKEKESGGMGGKITPCAMLVIQNGHTKLVNIKNQDTMTKILDMIPELIDKFTKSDDEKMTEDDIMEMLDKEYSK
ncbi:MAG: GerW family sporulation protein [Suipraeoptans sp.]